MHKIDTPFGEPGFLVLAGSRLFGIHTDESDYDYVGALIEPIDFRVGIRNHKGKGGFQHGFEQEEFSGENYEGTVYSLWKLAMMLAEGNPTIITTMFADPIRDDYGICTESFRNIVRCRASGERFLKYMQAQRGAMLGERKSKTNRPELIDAHGYDTKFAGHWLRLGYQGIEYLSTGNITLPMPDESTTAGCALNVREVRAGLWSKAEVIREGEALQARLGEAYKACTLPEHADYVALNGWVVNAYSYEYSLY
jgi:uncharacterized protein